MDTSGIIYLLWCSYLGKGKKLIFTNLDIDFYLRGIENCART